MMSKEQWKDVVGYEGLYQVSDCGNIKSLHRTRGTYERILKQRKRKKSHYLWIILCNKGIQKGFSIHRLVLLAFNGPCPKGMESRHLNGNSSDNRSSNLSWGTHSENMKDQVRHGTYVYARGSKSSRAILREKDVVRIKKLLISGRNGCPGQKYNQRAIARMFNVSPSTISGIKSKRLWRHLDD